MKKYDRIAVGGRIRTQRKALGLSQEDFAERIGRVPKFCADIERGQTGMSIDTLLAISSQLKITPDYLLLGKNGPDNTDETATVLSSLNQCTAKQRKDAIALLKLFLATIQ